ncbi:MAG: TonB family protein [Tabrizicola sp.]
MIPQPACPFLSLSPRRGAVAGWILSAAAVALVLSGLTALAMSAAPSGESLGEEPVSVLLIPALPALTALSEPAPVPEPDTPALLSDQPDPATETDLQPVPPAAEVSPVPQPEGIAPPETATADSLPGMDMSVPPAPNPAELAEARPEKEAKPAPEPAPKVKPAEKAKVGKPADKPARNERIKKTTAKATVKEAASHAAASAAPKKKTAAASAGNGKRAAANYGASVLKKIRKTKKAKAPAGGTVVVGFSISDSGGLASVRVLRSSGSAELDQVAADHIRRAAPFPPPPPGAERRFSFEFVGKL